MHDQLGHCEDLEVSTWPLLNLLNEPRIGVRILIE